ncbi:Cation/acetate symporter ActP [Paraconexibacter sp. AEG42_29]|uniref:Cation/acetate symporter ActP n=1 Tax=Paraconexibacter sp. AEG42_29 TaxID=2997339 RepID=A0AAU7AR18_9ACTN
MIALLAVGVVTLGGLGLGLFGVRLARSTSDVFVASRAISPWWNAAAISGEYLSAASFLGIAGLQMKIGASALWLPVGFAAGYLALLLFVAAPLRRFGAYTIPDFAEARLEARWMRVVGSLMVLVIGGFYLVPQLKGAGLTLGVVTGAPYWIGVAIVAVVVTVVVAFGGMRGITYVQAYQYWVKTFAILLPACLLLIHLGGLPARAALFGAELPTAPPGGLVVQLDEATSVEFPAAARYVIDGRAFRAPAGAERTLPAGELRLAAGTVVPVADDIPASAGRDWSRPVAAHGRASPVFVFSLLLATVLGTMGLPHILVRFYTNRDGPAARRTTVRVLGLLGLFYLFPVVYGLLGRVLVPELYITGATDEVVLRLPEAAWPGLGGELLGAVTAAGAFAAFLSTASGLLISLAGTVSYDLWERVGRQRAPEPADRVRRFRRAAPVVVALPALLALLARDIDISVLVGWAFALAASTFCPLFVLGIWWTGITARGAAAGMATGALTASAAILAGLMLDPAAGSATEALLTQPAAISVPLAFATMVLVSRRDRHKPQRVREHMRALHVPEALGLEPTRRA